MTLKDIADSFMRGSRGAALTRALSHGGRCVSVYNLVGSSVAVMLGAIPSGGRPVLVIGDSLDDAGYLYHDLSRMLGEDDVMLLPSAYKRDIKYGQVDPPSQILRTETLSRWYSDCPPRFVVTYPEALAEKVASRDTIATHTLRLHKDSPTDLTETIRWLRDNGFQEVDYVYEPGQFASRGSILDIFGYSHELPYRVDFFGDEIDSMRTFNIETQLSESRVDEISVTSNVASQSRGASLLDFVSPDTVIAVRDADYTLSRIRAVAAETFSESAMIAEEGDRTAMTKVVDAEDFCMKFDGFFQLRFSSSAAPDKSAGASIDFKCSPQVLYHKNFDLIAESFSRFIADGYTIYILSDSEKQIERLHAIFEDRGESLTFTPVNSTLHEGFVDHMERRCIFTDHQIFDRFHKYNLKSDRARSGKLALSLKELSAIEPGDFIVHVDHGVGRFAGLYRTNVSGRTQEMIKLVYANEDIIFVSIHSLHKLAKYRGKEGVPPRINKLGTGAWNKVKERTKNKLKDIARDLIMLYAARKQEKGFGFSPDTYMQHELEASFVYEDTPDQLTATKAVKADMESDRPMDRLICGDVGFGKTEVAIRAAFKAAADNKQTAVLVPTTVLAYQHYNTFSRRLKEFPVRVDYISRARTPKQVKQVLADLAEAINFEMSRNGQVFIINNRIEGLNELQAMVQRLVPDARTVIGHGQMPPEKLEKAILDFANHDYDVLLATTIIESGIDMPNVNTIVINNAQNFGLSELHQLRGRVGRSSRKAFCYLTVPPHVPLSPTSRRRLQAIESFSDLGSGIHIAMQDLDIRGAGNLLGAEQSGFIADLGYETYQKILKEAVTELRTEEFDDVEVTADGDKEYVADCVIESDMELLLPADYVPQESERISLYQELDSIEREMDLQAFRTRLIDRFGAIPQVTAELLRIPRLRRLARRLGIEKVALKQDKMYIYFVDDSNRAYYQSEMFGKLLRYLQENPRRCNIREKSGRRSFTISHVSTVEQAVHILQTVIDLPTM